MRSIVIDIYFLLSAVVTGYVLASPSRENKKGLKSLIVDYFFIIFYLFFGGLILLLAVASKFIGSAYKKAIAPVFDFFGLRVFMYAYFRVKKGTYTHEELDRIMNKELSNKIKEAGKIRGFFLKKQIWYVNKKNGTKPYSLRVYLESDNPKIFHFSYHELLKNGEIMDTHGFIEVDYNLNKASVYNQHNKRTITEAFGEERTNIVFTEIKKTKKHLVYKTIQNPDSSNREYSVLAIGENNYLVTAWLGHDLAEENSFTFEVEYDKETRCGSLVFKGEDMSDCMVSTDYLRVFFNEVEESIKNSETEID